MIKSATKKIIKRTGYLSLIIMTLFLLLGCGVGYLANSYITSNEYFELNGQDTMTLNIGDTYIEQGAKAKVLFLDVTDKIEISGSVDTTTAGEYYITYKLNEIRYRDFILVRKIIVEENE